MRKLEIAARDEFVHHGASGSREFVALGFEDPEDETITWFELTNAAGPGSFVVDPSVIQAVLDVAAKTLDPRSPCILWHSHYVSVEPSAEDYATMEQTGWLALGIVYHAPSGTTTLYNSAGIIALNDNSESPRDNQLVDFGVKAGADRARFFGGRDEDGM